jgi:hypothetical protein
MHTSQCDPILMKDQVVALLVVSIFGQGHYYCPWALIPKS